MSNNDKDTLILILILILISLLVVMFIPRDKSIQTESEILQEQDNYERWQESRM